MVRGRLPDIVNEPIQFECCVSITVRGLAFREGYHWLAAVMAVAWTTQLAAGHTHTAAVEAAERVRLADFRSHLGSRMTRNRLRQPGLKGLKLGLAGAVIARLPFCAQSAILAKCPRIATLYGLKCLFQTGPRIHLDG